NRFKAICDADSRWTYVDVGPSMLDKNARPRKDIFRSDSLHMNNIGYADWTRILTPYLKTAWKTSAQVEKAR
ncbi:hypothetical protein, partial [Salmonella enterica]|uniref:hypothetical protein n=1 Tax=Salmonella enterica TaxID=28901 RepID=UPI0020A36F29